MQFINHFIISCFLLLSYTYGCPFKEDDLSREAQQSTVELITNNGYVAEEYEVNTKDGYILKLYRVPNSRDGTSNIGSTCTVLLVESLTSTSKIYFDNLDQSIGFNLADAGCDVWAGEMRGTPDSRHVKYGRKKYRFNKFWDFGIEEMATIDAPAHIDFILEKTGLQQIFYIGYSRGTTVGFAMLSSVPDINKKVAGFIALAPSASCVYWTTLIRPLVPFINHTLGSLVRKGYWKVPNLSYLIRLRRCVTKKPSSLKYLMFGYDPYLVNKTREYLYVAHDLQGASLKTIAHYLQRCRNNERFSKYDYGTEENLRRYNSPIPPIYNMSSISSPVLLLVGPSDPVAGPLDATRIYQWLNKNTTEFLYVNNPMFTHADFYMASDGRTLVSNPVINFIKHYA